MTNIELHPNHREVKLFLSHDFLIAARALATYLIPGCVGRGVRLGSESSSATGGGGVWKSGDLEIWEFGNLVIWRSGDLEIQKCGVQKIKQIKIIKIQIHSAKNVGKVWISRKQILPALFGAIPGHFSMDRKNPKNAKILSVFANFPGVEPLLLSTRCGGIGYVF